MTLENWVVSVSKFKRAVLTITDHLVTRVNLEPLEDDEGDGRCQSCVGG